MKQQVTSLYVINRTWCREIQVMNVGTFNRIESMERLRWESVFCRTQGKGLSVIDDNAIYSTSFRIWKDFLDYWDLSRHSDAS